MNPRAVRGSVPFALAAAAVTALSIADSQFTGLGSLLPGNFIPGNFAFLSAARDVSFDGSVVVGFTATNAFESNVSRSGRRFRWTPTGGLELIPRPAFAAHEPTIDGLTDDGRTIAGSVEPIPGQPDPFTSRIYVQTFGEEPRTLAFIPGGGSFNPASFAFAGAISGDGSVVGGSGTAANFAQRAVFWGSPSSTTVGTFAPGAFTTTLPACTPNSQVKGLSRNGQFAIGAEEQPYGIGGSCITINRAVRWNLAAPGSPPLVLDPGSPIASVATAVSQDGTVVVGERSFTFAGGDTVSEMFRWTPQTGIVGLGNEPVGGVPSDRAAAMDVSADGRVIVGFVGSQAVVWDASRGLRTVRRALSDAGVSIGDWLLFTATAVSGNGRVIVGRGLNPEGREEAWRAVLPPVCIADFNGIAGVTIQDVVDFLIAYFAGSPSADINGRDGVTVQDVFDFLVLYFAGCPA